MLEDQVTAVDEALLKLVITVPAAAAVIVTAWMFLRAQKESNSQWAETIKDLHNSIREDRAESRECIRDNTRALARVAAAYENGNGRGSN